MYTILYNSSSTFIVSPDALNKAPAEQVLHISGPSWITGEIVKAAQDLISGHIAPNMIFNALLREVRGIALVYEFFVLADVKESHAIKAIRALVDQIDNLTSINVAYYFYLYIRNEYLCDLKAVLFTENALVCATSIKYEQIWPEWRLKVLSFIANGDFSQFTEDNLAETKAKLDDLEDQRARVWHQLLIDPFMFWPDVTYSPIHNDLVTKCSMLATSDIHTANILPTEGQSAIIAKKGWKAKFEEFTCGIFTKSINPDLKGQTFPWENVVVAGGAPTQILEGRPFIKHSDVDIFIYGKSYAQTKKTAKAVLAWFYSDKTYYGVKGSVVEIHIKDIERTFQVVIIKASNPYEVIYRFDLSYIQWLITKCKVDKNTVKFGLFGTPMALQAIRSRTTEIINKDYTNEGRLIKAMSKGYNLIIADQEQSGQLMRLFEPSNASLLNNILSSQKKMFSVSSKYDSCYETRAEEIEYYSSMLSKIYGLDLVSQDINKVANVTQYGNDFLNWYNSVGCDAFEVSSVAINIKRRNKGPIIVRSAKEEIRFVSTKLTLESINETDEVLIIKASGLDEIMKAFVAKVQTIVFRMYSHGLPTGPMAKDGNLPFEISKERINMAYEKEISIFTNNHGHNITHSEDLAANDVIKVIFKIQIDVKIKKISFILVSLIKFEDNVEEEIEQPKELAYIPDSNPQELTFD
jgi:hypothetical protein